MLRKLRSFGGKTLQNILRPFDLEIGHISERAQRLDAHRRAEAVSLLQLRNADAELQAARLQLARQKPRSAAAQNYIDRQSLILLPRLFACLAPEERFVIIDGGAREMELDFRWRPFPRERLRFFGFEADAGEAARLTGLLKASGLDCRLYPAALGGTSGKAVFAHNKASGGSLLLPQNRTVTDRWKFENPHQVSFAREMFFPTHSEEITVTTFADWARETGTAEVDFIKLNVQGAELDILKAGGKALDTALGLLVEVAFVESYLGRPMFSDIDPFLRGAGFTFFDLLAHHYIGRGDAPIAMQQLTIVEPALSKQVSAGGQLIEGHALYLRDPIADSRLPLAPSRVLKLAALAEAFGQVEYAFELLSWLGTRDDVRATEWVSVLDRVLREAAMEYETYRP